MNNTLIDGDIIDCFICGHQKQCSQVNVLKLMSTSMSVSLSMKNGQRTSEDGDKINKEKWSMIFCRILGLGMEADANASEDIVVNIVESAFYCEECQHGLQTVCQLFFEIKKLQKNLDQMRAFYVEKLETASRSRSTNKQFCSSNDQDQMILDDDNVNDNDDPNKEIKQMGKQERNRELLFNSICKHQCQLPPLIKVEFSNSPSNYGNENETNMENTTLVFNDAYCREDNNFQESTTIVAVLPSPNIQYLNKADEPNEKMKLADSGDKLIDMDPDPEYYQNQDTNACYNRTRKLRLKKSSRIKTKTTGKEKGKEELEPKQHSTEQLPSTATKKIYKKYFKPASLRKRKSMILPPPSSDCESEFALDDNDNDNDKDGNYDDIHDPDFCVEELLNNLQSIKKNEILSRQKPTTTVALQSMKNKAIGNAVRRTELRKYDGLIKKYDVKEVVVSVDKLPDADFDAAAVGGCDVEDIGKRRCPILGCNMIFLKKYRLADHLKTIHRGIKYPYECTTCHKKFAQRRQFVDHANIHAKLTPHICPVPDCGKRFSTLGRLFGHKGNHHKQPRYQCEECGKCFIIKSSYDYHIRSHLGERPFICEICGKTFIKDVDLKNHQRFHPELNLEQLKCAFCGKIFTSPNSLKVHEKFHSGDLPFPCDLCGYRAPTNYVLNKHKLVHKVGQNYECNICNGKFKHGNSLAKHKKYVCGTSKDCKDFICKFCGKGYKSKIHVAKHEKLHTDTSKPFLCSMCGKDFRFRDKLKRHIFQVHTDKREKHTLTPNRSKGKSKEEKPDDESTIILTQISTENNCGPCENTENTENIEMVYPSAANVYVNVGVTSQATKQPEPTSLHFHPTEFVQNYLP